MVVMAQIYMLPNDQDRKDLPDGREGSSGSNSRIRVEHMSSNDGNVAGSFFSTPVLFSINEIIIQIFNKFDMT